MEGMDLKKALEHDQAAKQAVPTLVPQEVTQTPVSIMSIGKQLDDKLAVMAKTVALGFLDVARSCQSLGLALVDQKIITDPKTGNQSIDGKPPRPDVAEKWMGIAVIAIDLAHKADVLGDRPIARREPAKE